MYLVITYSRDASKRPEVIHRSATIDDAEAFAAEFDKRQLPLAIEIALDRTEEEPNG